MCTVTVLPSAQGFTLTMNRDERRSRHESGLCLEAAAGRHYCYPVDAESGGTWVGMNDHGVALALLNRYQAPSSEHAKSRGGIIATGLGLGAFSSIAESMKTLPVDQYNAFDCLLVGRHSACLFSWNKEQYRYQTVSYDEGIMLTSSSERIEAVREYRQQQFTRWQAEWGVAGEVDRFHLQQSHDMQHSAVFMARENTHTKSLVQITVNASQGTLNYYDRKALQANSRLSRLSVTGCYQLSVSHA